MLEFKKVHLNPVIMYVQVALSSLLSELSSFSFLLQFDKYPTKVDPFYRHSVSFYCILQSSLLLSHHTVFPISITSVFVCMCVREVHSMWSLIYFSVASVDIH